MLWSDRYLYIIPIESGFDKSIAAHFKKLGAHTFSSIQDDNSNRSV